MRLFTIGFTKKSAKTFFEILIENEIRTVIDVRLNNKSQLAGFSKGSDLPYFLESIAGVDYLHMSNWAPKDELLKSYKKKEITWSEYEKDYLKMLDDRNVLEGLKLPILDCSCLLCSEPTPDNCHRRLLAEYLSGKLGNIDIVHL